MATDQRLRREIDELGRTFGETVKQFAGEESFDLVESVRGLARRFCDGELAAADELDTLLRDLTADQLRIVIRSFGTFLELANLAEDRQRIRSLADREREHYPNPRKESILDAVRALNEQGLTAAEMAALVERVRVELVFTAHPTEAKRKSIRAKLRSLRELLSELDNESHTQRDEEKLRGLVKQQLMKCLDTPRLDAGRLAKLLEEESKAVATEPRVRRRALREMFAAAIRKHHRQLLDQAGDAMATDRITRSLEVWLEAEAELGRNANQSALVQVLAERLARIAA